MVKGIHDPLVSEQLFYEVQRIINTKRVVTAKSDILKATFFLKGFLICPYCNRSLCGSISHGRTKKYPYYHCCGRCKTRINALFLNDCYQEKLQQLVLSDKATELFSRILKDCNSGTQKTEYMQERKMLVRRLQQQELTLSQARKLFVGSVLKVDDFTELKKEYQTNSKCLKRELLNINAKLKNIEAQCLLGSRSSVDIFQVFPTLDTADRKHLVTLLPPLKVDFQTGSMILGLSSALSKILLTKK
jgi:hypothetical protein